MCRVSNGKLDTVKNLCQCHFDQEKSRHWESYVLERGVCTTSHVVVLTYNLSKAITQFPALNKTKWVACGFSLEGHRSITRDQNTVLTQKTVKDCKHTLTRCVNEAIGIIPDCLKLWFNCCVQAGAHFSVLMWSDCLMNWLHTSLDGSLTKF